MSLKSLELDLEWPLGLPVKDLRSFVVEQLRLYGEPLRWAITEINYREQLNCSRHLKVEAVVILM